jgi:peptidoglycan hydrolase CwlO-like protein
VEEARQRLREADSRRNKLLSERNELRRLIPSTQNDLKNVKAEIRSLKSKTKQACIKYRNDYLRPAIQEQFAEGIRE